MTSDPSGNSTSPGGVCVACNRSIDASARMCPYCGADPSTGQKVVDTQTMMEEVFRPRTVTTSESVMEYARQRQGIVVAVSIIVALLILAGLHQFVTMRNASAVSDAPAVPLTEISDIANKPEETTAQPLPEMNFQYDGRPQAMRTYITEPGAIPPPEVVAQQAPPAAGAAIQRPPTALPPPQPR